MRRKHDVHCGRFHAADLAALELSAQSKVLAMKPDANASRIETATAYLRIFVSIWSILQGSGQNSRPTNDHVQANKTDEQVKPEFRSLSH